MDLETLRALMNEGAERSFCATYGTRSEGARGVVERVGFPAAPHAVVIRDIVGNTHHWDARHVSLI